MGFSEWLAAGRAIASGDLVRHSGTRQYCARFERDIAGMTGARHALIVNSGTSALVTALAAAGVGPGDEVLVPAYTWMATAAAPVLVGAVPILVDVDATLTMDCDDLEAKISPHTRAIIPVHMLNRPCDMERIMAIARARGILVIEDACQAVGVRYREQFCGAIGDAGAFSFNQYKNMSIGEGGAVLTDSDRLIGRAWNYHDLGISYRDQSLPVQGDEVTFIGTNLRGSEIQGAMLGAQLRRLPGRLRRLRRRHDLVHDMLHKAGLPVTPHNDPANAVSLTLTFETEREAIRFSERRGVARVFDNSKHVYTNWDAILERRTFHPRMDPWGWAPRKIDYGKDMCARSLDILRRTCKISLGEGYPMIAVQMLARRLAA